MFFNDFSGKQSVFYQSLFQMPFLIPFIILDPGILTPKSLGSVIGLGLICSVFAYVLIYDGISKVKGQQIGILQSIEYVLPVFIGVYLFDESIRLLPGIGITLIIISCVLITFFTKRSE
jgi:drug/metabolite transporter (DMT)-like permease